MEASSADSVIGTRKSERHKKPSLRFNEEAGFLVEPPRSAKKKGACKDSSKAAADGAQAKLEDSMAIIRRSLEFLDPQVEEAGRVPASEEVHV